MLIYHHIKSDNFKNRKAKELRYIHACSYLFSISNQNSTVRFTNIVPQKDNAKAKRFFKFTKNTLKNIVIGYSSLILCEVRKYLKNNGYVLLKYELKFWINNNHKISNQNIDNKLTHIYK